MHSEHTAQITAQPAGSLVLEILPSGEPAWLRPELDTAIRDASTLDAQITRRLGWPENHPALQERIGITQAGRDALAREQAMVALFGPWPSVAEACA